MNTTLRDEILRLGERLWPDAAPLRPRHAVQRQRMRRALLAITAATLVAAVIVGGTILLRSRAPLQPQQPAAANTVPWMDAPVHDGVVPYTIPSIPACRMSDLHVSIPSSIYANGGPIETQFWDFTVIDISSHGCYLARPFDVRFRVGAGEFVSQTRGAPLGGEIIYLAPSSRPAYIPPPFVTTVSGEMGYGPCRLDHLSGLLLSISPFPETTLVVPGTPGGVASCRAGTRQSYYSEFFDAHASPYVPMTVTSLGAPAVLHPGERVRFTATIEDVISPYRHCAIACPTPLPMLPWTPCPTYHEELQGVPDTLHAYTLNCAIGGPLLSEQSRTFEMYIDVPLGAAMGPAVLAWSLDGAPALYGTAYAPVLVEP